MSTERITPGTVIGGHFEIERLANTGGMGEVFRARDRRTNLPVAVKVVRNIDAVHLSRFDRETRTLAQFEHPGIVRYIAHGREPSVFLAMEWLDGEDLSHRLAKGPLSITDTLMLAKTVGEALVAAHERGIVHRDIKPSNIFLCDGRIEAAKIVDFGIAQVTQSTRAITGTGQILGTLGYMAPEQALSGRDVTSAVDVYSLGCVLYECITGQSPFAGEWPAVLTKILMSDPPRIRELRADAPLALEELVMRMLRRDPQQRATLAAVAGDIAAFLTAGEMLGADERASANVPAVTGDERRLVAVIVMDTAHAHSPELLGAADTVPSSNTNLHALIMRFGGELTILPDGTSVAILSGAGGTDLAARAARCALAAKEHLGSTRIAIASGRGDPTRPSVIATVVDRAGLLVGDAPGQVSIDPIIAGLLDASFVVSGEGGALVLVGEQDQAAGGTRRLLGETTPCVGRERELAMLRALVSECLDEPLATALVITGNPGVGKSRLLHEILQGVRAREDAPDVWIARGDPIAAGSPLGMLAQLLNRMAGLEKGEVVPLRRQKLLTRVGRHLGVHEAMRVAEVLGDVVGAEFSDEDHVALRAARRDPAAMTDQVRRAWEELVAAEVDAGPVVIVLEDLQWGDLPTVRLVDGALRSQKHRPLLVVSVARPDVTEVFPGLFRDRRVHELRLGELTPSASRRLVIDVLGPTLDAKVVDALVETSHGNPFYLEELIRSVAEGESSLPETVLATAQARLQRLDPGPRRLLRAASVFGTKFWVGGVASLVGADPADVRPMLETLVQREVVMPQPSSRFRGEDEYAFRQTLFRDAAYDMLTARDRREAHALAAEWLESNGERDALVLAEHLERSHDKTRAVVWYLWAAEQALEGNDLEGVLARAERGAECGATGATLGELTLLKAEASGWAGLDTHFLLASSALELLPTGSSGWTRAAGELAIACRTAGDHERLREVAERVAAVPVDVASLLVHAFARARIVVSLLGVGNVDLARRLLATVTEALADVERADPADAPTITMLVEWLELAVTHRGGDPKPFLVEAKRIADAFETEGYARWAALVALQAAAASAKVGDVKHGMVWAERAGALARRLGLKSSEIRSRAWHARLLADSGHADAALTTAESAVRDAVGDRVAEADASAALEHVKTASTHATMKSERATTSS